MKERMNDYGTVTVDGEYKITIPHEAREAMGIRKSTVLSVQVTQDCFDTENLPFPVVKAPVKMMLVLRVAETAQG
ncbi:MAG: AbrB/MazE/SpoVT family DNA-binding domain-containing protein [Aigarchaeota archaeon]|nr:AbrB/MazE/SpoVT family DNA-binding domain-containing protein [Aigarchaeota archaeon]